MPIDPVTAGVLGTQVVGGVMNYQNQKEQNRETLNRTNLTGICPPFRIASIFVSILQTNHSQKRKGK